MKVKVNKNAHEAPRIIQDYMKKIQFDCFHMYRESKKLWMDEFLKEDLHIFQIDTAFICASMNSSLAHIKAMIDIAKSVGEELGAKQIFNELIDGAIDQLQQLKNEVNK